MVDQTTGDQETPLVIQENRIFAIGFLKTIVQSAESSISREVSKSIQELVVCLMSPMVALRFTREMESASFSHDQIADLVAFIDHICPEGALDRLKKQCSEWMSHRKCLLIPREKSITDISYGVCYTGGMERKRLSPHLWDNEPYSPFSGQEEEEEHDYFLHHPYSQSRRNRRVKGRVKRLWNFLLIHFLCLSVSDVEKDNEK